MKRPRRRRFVPTLTPLEGRLLLSGASGTWLGQDGHDLAGGPTPMAGNGVQDIHIRLSNLPAGRTIASVQVLGYGGGGWVYNIGPYEATSSAALMRNPGATTADLYFEPYQVETGRQFDLTVTYDDRSTDAFSVNGGAADPNLWTPAYLATARWVGQDGVDLTGPSAGVGPDGVQDAHLTLGHLYPGSPVAAVAVTDASGHGWASGTNPALLNNAEYRPVANDPTRGDLYFSPGADPSGRVLSVTVTYANGKSVRTSFVAGHADPNLAEPGPGPTTVSWDAFHARWVGQDGLNLVGAGDVHLALDGLPAGRSVVSATLSDESGLDWTYIKPGSGASQQDPAAGPLGFRAGPAGTQADVGFPPARDETGATLTLVLVLDDGATLATHVSGDFADPGLRASDVAPTQAVAHPGDDLNALANSYGSVRLAAGVYTMNAPLVLNHPVTITADPGATLMFAQGGSGPAWTAAIKVRASHTTLNGFAVRFAGPVRWVDGISYGPAVVGTSDNFDVWNGDPLVDLTFTNLDLQSPPAATSWEEAVRLFRLVSAQSGTVSNNVLYGGVTELQNGPWQITGNAYLGTPANTFTYGVFTTHYSHDVTIAANTAAPQGRSGKVWRFLVMTQSGSGDVVSGNTVTGVGPMDSDTVPNPNASEIILTEAYRVHYEGLASSVSADGYVVQIPAPQGTPARTGDVLAVLSGPQAGQWRKVAQVLSPTAYVLDAPITPGKFAVSLATGFTNERFLGNTVDARGSSTALDLVLVGNQFGASVVGNHFLGGGYAFRISACPTEMPVTWGWTHAPFLGAKVESNTIEDSLHGGQLNVQHGGYIKADAGRVYFSGSFVDNTGVWSASFLTSRAASGVTGPPWMATVGDALSGDPGDLVLTASGNSAVGPASVVSGPTLLFAGATVNGSVARNLGVVLPVGSSTTAGPPPGAPPSPPVPTPVPIPPSPPAPAAMVAATATASAPAGSRVNAATVAPARAAPRAAVPGPTAVAPTGSVVTAAVSVVVATTPAPVRTAAPVSAVAVSWPATLTVTKGAAATAGAVPHMVAPSVTVRTAAVPARPLPVSWWTAWSWGVPALWRGVAGRRV